MGTSHSTDSDSYVSFSSEDGTECAPFNLSDMIVNDNSTQHTISTMTFKVCKIQQRGDHVQRHEGTLDVELPDSKGEAKLFPDTMVKYLKAEHPGIVNNLQNVDYLRSGSFMYFGRSLVSTLNVENPRIRLPNDVISDVCVFTRDRPVLVLTILQDNVEEADACEQYNTYLARGINEGLRDVLTDISVVSGTVTENGEINIRLREIFETQTCLLSINADMSPSKCKMAFESFLRCIAVSKISRIVFHSDSFHPRYLSKEEFAILINNIDAVEPVNIQEGATLLLMLELTCRIARRGRTLLQLPDKLETVDVEKLCDYNPLLSNTFQNIRYKYDVVVRECCDETFLWTFSNHISLHTAAGNKSTVLIYNMLKNGAGVNEQDHDGSTSLHIAAEGGAQECVDVLLRFGADKNIQDRDGYMPLHKAVGSGSKECVDLLVRAGADTNAHDNHGYSAVHMAAGSGSAECMDVLIKAGGGINDLDQNDYTPLHRAAGIGSADCVKVLLKAGADVNKRDQYGHTPLHRAAKRGAIGCLEALLQAGAEANTHDQDGYTPLHNAALSECKECIQLICKFSADVNVQDKYGYTPLHRAAWGGSRECIKQLIKCGADVNARAKDGCTPLHNAAAIGSTECVIILLKDCADVNVRSEDSCTPLHKAAGSGSKDCVATILKAGAQFNKQDRYGCTPLHRASESGSKECVAILLKAGADVNIEDQHGKTPLHRVAGGASQECVYMLYRHLA